MFNTISMIGLGYIGLPTATLFASRKKKVIGVDVSKKTVETINQGKIHIVEPELDILVHAAVTAGYLIATTTPQAADAFLIAPGWWFATPSAGYAAVKYLGTVTMSLACVPVYLLARLLVSTQRRAWSCCSTSRLRTTDISARAS